MNGTQIGSAVVNSLGEANLELSTQRGNAVPSIKKGDKVKVKTAAGVLIVSGTF